MDMDRRYELENLRRRSIIMLSPGVNALSREEAMRLVAELAVAQERLDRLRAGLHRLLEDDGP